MAEELDAIGVMSQLDARALNCSLKPMEYRHHCETLDRGDIPTRFTARMILMKGKNVKSE
jgi:hypothetical protein